jgi:asparagine synthetase B (glutamine-hydrolysing)
VSGLCAGFDRADERLELESLRRLAKVSARRGRDGITYWTRGAVGLAHLASRSTPEAVNETQPTVSDDRRICLTADARIDRRVELAEELREAGTLRSAHPTDAQLILAAYEFWVEECPAHLDGDFAFVLWDGRKEQLLAARDPCGVRDLHHLRSGDRLWLATDPSQLLSLPGASRVVDRWWLADFLLDLSIEPRRGPFPGTERLQPGHRLIATRDQLRIGPTPPTSEPLRAEDPFDAACRRRLRSASGVVGLALDGGEASRRLRDTVGRLAAEARGNLEIVELVHGPEAIGREPGPPSTGDSPSLDPPLLDGPDIGVPEAERALLAPLVARGGDVLLTTRGCSAPTASAPRTVPTWLHRDFVTATDLVQRVRAAEAVGPTATDSYSGVAATVSLERALTWQERIAAGLGVEMRHPWLDRRLGERAGSDGAATVSPAALREARAALEGRLRICDQEVCRAAELEAAIRSATEEQAGESAAADRAALWRALAVERWLRAHDLAVAG